MAPKRQQASSGKRGKTTPAPKRRLSKKAPVKAVAKAQVQRKSAAKRQQSAARKECRKSIHSSFSAARRADVLQHQTIEVADVGAPVLAAPEPTASEPPARKPLGDPPAAPKSTPLDVPKSFGEPFKAPTRSLSEVDAVTQRKSEARAALAGHRLRLLHLAGQPNSGSHVDEVASEVRHAIKAFGKLPSSERTGVAVADVITAFEAVDVHLNQAHRKVLGGRLGDRLATADAAQHLRKALGDSLGGRLVTLLQRWNAAASALKWKGSPATPTPVRSRRQRQAKLSEFAGRGPPSSSSAVPLPAPSEPAETAETAEPAGDGSEVGAQTRNKVVGILMRTSSHGAGKAAFQECRKIEEELFKQYGSLPKEYRKRARSLSYNLGAGDGALLKRVLDGKLSPTELVSMSVEELAPEAVREERERERERYFKEQVHLTERVTKRRRTIFAESLGGRVNTRWGAADEEEKDTQMSQNDKEGGEEAQDLALQDQPTLTRRLSRRRSREKLKESGEKPKEGEGTSVSSDSGSDSSSSDSGSSASESSEIDLERELGLIFDKEFGAPALPPSGTAKAGAKKDAENASTKLQRSVPSSQQMPPVQAVVSPSSAQPTVPSRTDFEIAKALQEADSSSSSSSSSSDDEAHPQEEMSMAQRKAHLLSMGFSAKDADAALVTSKGSLERAVAILVRKRG